MVNDDPEPDRGFSVYRSDDLAIIAVIWAPDSGAPIHNHNGWAVEGVIKGKEINHNYRRLDDGSEPWRAKLEEVDPSAVSAGETTSLLLPPNDIHSVDIPEGKNAGAARLRRRSAEAVALPLRCGERRGHAVPDGHARAADGD